MSKTTVSDTRPCCSREARREERRGGDFNHCDRLIGMVRLEVVQVTMVIDSDMDMLISVLYNGANSIDRFEAGLASNFRWLHLKLSSMLSPEATK